MLRKNKRRDDDQIYDAKLSIRLSKELAKKIEQQAERSHCGKNEIVRLALAEYMNRNMTDTEFFHASLADVKHRLYRVENKLKKYPAAIYAAVEELITLLRPGIRDEELSLLMEDFGRRTANVASSNRIGAFEAILIDVMEGLDSENTETEDK